MSLLSKIASKGRQKAAQYLPAAKEALHTKMGGAGNWLEAGQQALEMGLQAKDLMGGMLPIKGGGRGKRGALAGLGFGAYKLARGLRNMKKAGRFKGLAKFGKNALGKGKQMLNKVKEKIKGALSKKRKPKKPSKESNKSQQNKKEQGQSKKESKEAKKQQAERKKKEKEESKKRKKKEQKKLITIKFVNQHISGELQWHPNPRSLRVQHQGKTQPFATFVEQLLGGEYLSKAVANKLVKLGKSSVKTALRSKVMGSLQKTRKLILRAFDFPLPKPTYETTSLKYLDWQNGQIIPLTEPTLGKRATHFLHARSMEGGQVAKGAPAFLVALHHRKNYWNRGHLVAKTLGGAGDSQNWTPQDFHSNQKQQRHLEVALKKQLLADPKRMVHYRVKAEYLGEPRKPDGKLMPAELSVMKQMNLSTHKVVLANPSANPQSQSAWKDVGKITDFTTTYTNLLPQTPPANAKLVHPKADKK